MLFVLIILLLTGVLLGGTYFYMNKKDVVGDTEIIGPSPTLPDKVIQPKIYKPVYPKAQFIKVGKIGIVEDFKNRSINLMEIYVYDKDGKNIALKKSILSNTTFGDFKNTLYNLIDGDEMTMGRTGNEKEDDTQPQRQSFEIDLGSMHEIRSVVLLDKIKGDPGRLDKLKVMLLDDNLQIVDKTSNLTTEQAKKGTKHRYDFGTKKWTLEPVDCVGKWGEWSACSTGCVEEGKNNEGQKKRDWITLRKAENGGKACVYDLNKDGFKTCKGECNVEICYSCGFGNCKVFKNGTYQIHSFPNDAISSIKVPTGRKVEAWYHAINYYGGGAKLNLVKNTDLCRENTNFNNQISHLRIS